MSKKVQTDAAPAKPALVHRATNFASYYVNNTSITGTPWDIALMLGRIVDIQDGAPIVEQFAQVYMSPQHAKAVAELLTKQLAHYEATHGVIPSTGYVTKGSVGKALIPKDHPPRT